MATTWCMAVRANLKFATEAARNQAYTDIKGQCIDHGSGATEKVGRFQKWDEDPGTIDSVDTSNASRESL